MLSWKIEDLQGQIYVLEERNKEYYEMKKSNDQNPNGDENSKGDLEGRKV